MPEVVWVPDSSRLTRPTPGTSTLVGPPAVRVTFLPSAVTFPRTFALATGFLPASQTALEVTFSTSTRESSGSPGTWTEALARFASASARVLSAVALEVATSARRTLTGWFPSTPSRVTVSAVFSAVAGALTSFRVAFRGTCTVLLSRPTSSPARRTTAPALPSPPAPPPPVANAGGAVSRATAPVASRTAAGMRKVLLFKVVEPPGRWVPSRRQWGTLRAPTASTPESLRTVGERVATWREFTPMGGFHAHIRITAPHEAREFSPFTDSRPTRAFSTTDGPPMSRAVNRPPFAAQARTSPFTTTRSGCASARTSARGSVP